jgi:high-affinity nickel-transport protein
VALIAATTIQSRLWASAYLALFGLGTIVGMSALTFVLSWPMAWASRRDGVLSRGLARIPGVLSVGLGLLIGLEALLEVAR